MLRRFADLRQLVARAGFLDVFVQQVGEADDRVHRRADLVTHVGQEGAFGAVGRLGGILRFGQRVGTVGDELLQVVAVLFQLGLGLLARADVDVDAEEFRRLARHLDDRVA